MLDILFVSDYVCPYCLVAKEALLQSLEKTGIEAKITWHPFELTMEPKPRVDTYNDPVRKSHYQVLVEPCKAMNLDMKLPPAVVPRPYTRLAFEGYHFAKANGKGDAYNTAVYNAYFLDEKDIGDPAILAELAAGADLDKEAFLQALNDGSYKEEEYKTAMHAREEMDVHSVPTIYINGKQINIKTYMPEEMEEILKAADAAEEESPLILLSSDEDEVSFSGCGPDGCGFGPENEATDDVPEFTGCGPDGC